MKIRIPTKLGFKNPKHVMEHVRSPTNISAAIGKIRATTGSAGLIAPQCGSKLAEEALSARLRDPRLSHAVATRGCRAQAVHAIRRLAMPSLTSSTRLISMPPTISFFFPATASAPKSWPR